MTRCQTFTHMNITLSTLVDSTHISSLYIHVYCRCIEHITIIIIFISKLRQTVLKFNTERTRLHTDWHFTRTVCHCSLILRSFRARPMLTEDEANGFMKALYNSRIYEFATVCPKFKILRMCKQVIVLLKQNLFCSTPTNVVSTQILNRVHTWKQQNTV